jgi:hypothetical protein
MGLLDWLKELFATHPCKIGGHLPPQTYMRPHPKDLHECMIRVKYCPRCQTVLNPEVFR